VECVHLNLVPTLPEEVGSLNLCVFARVSLAERIDKDSLNEGRGNWAWSDMTPFGIG